MIDEIIDLRRKELRFMALADDNFYAVTPTDLRLTREQSNVQKLESLMAVRSERFMLIFQAKSVPALMYPTWAATK